MQRSQTVIVALIYSFFLLLLAVVLGFSIYGFLQSDFVTGGILLFFFVLGCLFGVNVLVQRKFEKTCVSLFLSKQYEKERVFLEKWLKSPFYFVVRANAMQHYSYACAALDDLATAKRYIDRIRHGAGKGWRYRTAYLYILILLDEGDWKGARAEYDDFIRDCANAEVYLKQIEVLRAVFARVFSLKYSSPLPESAIESAYPVVSRILGRQYEEGAPEKWRE